MLDIYVGESAQKEIEQNGIHQRMFNRVLGASGGPKWFTLFGLDKYLFGEFFKGRTEPLDMLGTSAGAFRFGALSQSSPVAAISILADIYSHTVYSANADANEVSDKAIELLDAVYTPSGIAESVNNPVFRPHFIVAKCSGLTSFENKIIQTLGLVASLGLNRIDRGLLKHQYQRYLFRPLSSKLTVSDEHQFETQYKELTVNNFYHALLASGSIPLVMRGIKSIAGCPNGMYRDGGIIDYHFDLALHTSQTTNNQGLTLYPHFSQQPKAGWFDKNLSRRVHEKHYDNIVMITPSKQFINSLPFGKIPDRKDFTDMDASTRIKYWQKVLSETDRLAESFHHLVEQQDISQIKLFKAN